MSISKAHSKAPLPTSVSEIGRLKITGNIIPNQWLKTLTLENGRPDTYSILILADILYWYRPTEIRDEKSGALLGYRKKFAEELLRRSYSDLEAQFEFSKKQCQEPEASRRFWSH